MATATNRNPWKRAYTAPVDSERCEAAIKHGAIAKEGARCMHRRVAGSKFCKQHELARHAGACNVNFTVNGKPKPCDYGLKLNFDPLNMETEP